MIVFNNPTIQPAYVAYDVGLFAQDSWTMKRLTINPGIRVVWIETGMYESSMAAGRFAPARFIEEEKGLIDFGADYSPRISAVYDLFGNGRTALKTSWSKYYRNYDGDIAAGAYGKAGERSENRQWFDIDLIPGTNTPTARSRAMCRAQSCRPIATASRRTTRSARRPAANFGEPDAAVGPHAGEPPASVQRRVHARRAAPGDATARRRRDVLQAQDRRHVVRGSAAHHAHRLGGDP